MAVYNAIKYDQYKERAGAYIPIKTLTAAGDATLSFTNGTSDVVLDATYDEYFFIFNNIHPSQDGADLSFQVSTDTGSSFGVNITSTAFQTSHNEDNSATALAYESNIDLAQSTNFCPIGNDTGNDADQCISGFMRLYAPSSATFVKLFMAATNNANLSDITMNNFHAGYVNSTSAVDAIQFKFDGGTLDAGTIQMFGVH